MMIPEIDAQAMIARDPDTLELIREAAQNVGFLTLSNTSITAADVQKTLDAYRQFFTGPMSAKEDVSMATTGSNRGWGGSRSEQVNPDKNPDYKEVFDCGVQVPTNDPQAHLSVYAPNLWPSTPSHFQDQVEGYFTNARDVAKDVLQGISVAIGADADFFADKFDKPMALLRGNYYPKRPASATDKDFGIAAHTDYGCLTLLATDGQAGLEVKMRDGRWIPLSAQPGTFIINFGEMLEMWSGGKIKATLHRVIGGENERLSIPLFFNPNYDTNVAAPEAEDDICAGDYLTNRYAETYVHLQNKKS